MTEQFNKINNKNNQGKMSVKFMTLVALMVAFTAVCAQIAIPLPFSPLPVTLQTFALMLCSLLLGPKYAVITFVVYLLAGAFGAPVFANGKAGFGVLLGSTGGFILSWLPASALIGVIASKSLGSTMWWLRDVVACVTGLSVMYLLGAAQFAMVGNVSFAAACVVAVLPFLPMEIIKIFLAISIARKLKKRGVV